MIEFESFTYPLFEVSTQADPQAQAAAFLAVSDRPGAVGHRGVYVHIPFCDTICNFCPFVKSVVAEERVQQYLEALAVEIKMRAATPRIASWKVDAIYIGGGTPSVLSPRQISELLSLVRSSFDCSADCEITVEVEAKSADLAFLNACVDGGATRISFGVQTLDPFFRELANLTATKEQIEQLMGAGRTRFADVNVDMIVGFPGQTVEQAVEDVRSLLALDPVSVSLYPMDYAVTLPSWQAKIVDGRLPKPAKLPEREVMFHSARAVLAEALEEQNMYCFGLPNVDPCRYMFDILYGGYSDECIGLGAGAYTYLRGLAFHNTASEQAYVKQLDAGEMPVAVASPGHCYEKGLVFFPKRLEHSRSEIDRLDMPARHRESLRLLEEQGKVRIATDSIELTELGKAQYSELMLIFFSDSQLRLYDRVVRRMRTDVGNVDLGIKGSGTRDVGSVNAMTRRAVRGDIAPAESRG